MLSDEATVHQQVTSASPPPTSPASPKGRRSPRGPAGGVEPSVRGARGKLVELVRLIIVALFAVAGWEVAAAVRHEQTSALALGIVVGSGVGYVLGGAFGRRTAVAVSEAERELRKVPAPVILASAIGLVVGLVLAALVSIPLFHLPAGAAYPAVAFAYVTSAYAGARIGQGKAEELFALFGVKPKAAGTGPGEVSVLDSSALLDGRLLSLVRLGFLRGTMLVAREVLDELQMVADSSDPVLRTRGRRALDLLVTLKRDPAVDLVLVEDPPVPGEAVDARLVRLTRARGAVLVTNDAALAKLAAALEASVRSINALAEAMRTPMVPGDALSLRVTRRGRERGQGVGYTTDGTMVVVDRGEDLVGRTVPVTITNVIQTPTGQLGFARLEPAPEA
jgi:uncharacterized protein YacL